MRSAPTVQLRPARACDGAAVGAFLDGLSVHNRRQRFHGACSGASPALQRLLCDVDGVRHLAWLAWAGEGEAAVVVGEARFVVAAGDAAAEIAIAVADAWQGSGLAHALIRQLLVAAASAGVPALYGDVLDGNDRMLAFLRRHGFHADRFLRGGTRRMRRDLRPPVSPAGASLHAAGARPASLC